MIQEWFCEGCKKTGSVALQDPADVYSAIYALEDDHRAVSPNCESKRLSAMRVRAPGCSQAEWDRTCGSAA